MNRRSVPRVAMLVIAFIAVLIGGVVGVLTERSAPSAGSGTYRSQTTLLFDQLHAVASSGDAGVLAKLSLLRVKYVDLLQTSAITGPVARKTGLPEPTVRGALQATAPPAQFVLAVTATLAQPAQARELATAAADELIAYNQHEQSSAGIPADQQVTISVVSPAQPATQVAASRRRAVAYGAAAAVGAALLVVAGASLLVRPRLRLAL